MTPTTLLPQLPHISSTIFYMYDSYHIVPCLHCDFELAVVTTAAIKITTHPRHTDSTAFFRIILSNTRRKICVYGNGGCMRKPRNSGKNTARGAE